MTQTVYPMGGSIDTVIAPSQEDIRAWRVQIQASLHSARQFCRRTGEDQTTGGLAEAVGIIWSDASISGLVNQARSSERFSVSESQFADVLSRVDPEQKTFVSLFHSHPQGFMHPSNADRQSIKFQWTQAKIFYPWTIIDPHSEKWSFWWFEMDKVVGEVHEAESVVLSLDGGFHQSSESPELVVP